MAVVTRDEITITDLNDGQNVVQLVLTNENHTLTANASGVPTSYAGASTTAYVYDGATDVTSQYTLTKTDPSGVTSSVSGKTVTVTAITNGVGGSITITLTKGSTVLTKAFNVSVSKTGSGGAAAKAVNVTPSSQVFKSTTGATGTFTPQYIYLYPSFQGGITYSKWQYSTDGTTWNNVTSGSNSLTIGTYNSVANSLRIERTCNLYTSSITAISFKCVSSDASYYDTETITKVYDVTDIQVGGRNYILNSEPEFTETIPNAGYTFLAKNLSPIVQTLDPATKVFTFSAEAYSETPDNTVLQMYLRGTENNVMQYINMGPLTGSWKRYSIIQSIKDDKTVEDVVNLYVRVQGASGDVVHIRKIKCEIGNIATAWTQAPEDVETEIIDKTSDYVVGTQTSITYAWTGVSNLSELKDGTQITYFLPYNAGTDSTKVSYNITTTDSSVSPAKVTTTTNTGVALNLTLADGSTTGNVPAYYRMNERLTTHYYGGSIIRFVYKSPYVFNTSSLTTQYSVDRAWVADANYNTDTYDRLRYNVSIQGDQMFINGGRLIASGDTSYQVLSSGVTFRTDKPILYAASDIAIIGTSSNNYLMFSTFDLRNNLNNNAANYLPAGLNTISATKWYRGNKITGTSTTGTVFSGSGVSNAVSNSSGANGDYYTNSDNGNVYKCTLGGAASVAKWAYVKSTAKPLADKWFNSNNINGTTTTETVYSNSGISNAAVGTHNFNSSSGNYYECTLAGNASTAKWLYKGPLIQKGQTVYLRGTISGKYFTVDAVPFTTVIPTTDDGLYYMSIGLANSTYQISLFPEHPMYKYINGAFTSLDEIGYNAQIELNNLEIGGTNILRGSEKPTSDYYTKTGTVVSGASFKTCSVEKTSAAWGGIGFNFRTQVEERNFVQAGDTFTFSVWARTDETTKTIKADITADGTLNGEGGSANRFIPTRDVMGDPIITSVWKQFYYTFTVPANRLATGNGSIESTRIEQNTACTDGCYVYWACPKLEVGNKPTDWSPSPEDLEPNIIAQLANESYTFAADSAGVPLVSTLEVPIYGFKGATQVATSIGTISGAPTGMTTYISGQGTTSNKFTVSLSSSLVADSGVLTIPITVEDTVITKNFTWAKSKAGADGTPASLVTISPTDLFFKSTDGGQTYGPSYIYLYPQITTDLTYSKWEYSKSTSNNQPVWNTVTSGQHGLTIGTYDGHSNSLRVSSASDLYSSSVTQVAFRVTATKTVSGTTTSFIDITSLTRLKDGKDGEDGTSSYLHIKYSDDGMTFTANSGDTPGQYIGILVDENPVASTTFSDYTWKKFTEDFTAEATGNGILQLSQSAGKPMLEMTIEGNTYQPTNPTWADPVQPSFVSKDNVLTMISLNNNRVNPRQVALTMKSGTTAYGTDAEATPLDNGLRVTSLASGTGTSKMVGVIIQNPDDLLGKTVTLEGTIYKSASNNGYAKLTWFNTDSGDVSSSVDLGHLSGSGGLSSFTIPASYNSGYNGMILLLYSAYSGTGNAGDYVEYTDLTLHVGDVGYEPFQAIQSDIDLEYSELCSLPDGTKNTLTITNNSNIYWCPVGQYKFNGTEDWTMSTKTNTYAFTTNAIKSSYTNGYSNYSKYASGTADNEHFNISSSGLVVYFPKNFSYIDSQEVSHTINSVDSFQLYLSYLNSIGEPFYVIYKLMVPKSIVLPNCYVDTEFGTGILYPQTYNSSTMAPAMTGTYFIQTDISDVFASNHDLLSYQTIQKALADLQAVEDTISGFATTYVTSGTLEEQITQVNKNSLTLTPEQMSLVTTRIRDAMGTIEDVEKIVNGVNLIDMSNTTDKTKSGSGLTISVYTDDVLGPRIKVNGTASADVVFKLSGTGSGAPATEGQKLKAGDAYCVYGLIPGVTLYAKTYDTSSSSYVELFDRNSSQSSTYYIPADDTVVDYIYLQFNSGASFEDASFSPKLCSGVALSANMSIMQSYINWSGDALWIGKSTSSVRMKLENNKLSFLSGTDEVAYISNSTLFITDATVQLVQRLGKPSLGYWETRFDETTRNLNTKWVGATQGG